MFRQNHKPVLPAVFSLPYPVSFPSFTRTCLFLLLQELPPLHNLQIYIFFCDKAISRYIKKHKGTKKACKTHFQSLTRLLIYEIFKFLNVERDYLTSSKIKCFDSQYFKTFTVQIWRII